MHASKLGNVPITASHVRRGECRIFYIIHSRLRFKNTILNPCIAVKTCLNLGENSPSQIFNGCFLLKTGFSIIALGKFIPSQIIRKVNARNNILKARGKGKRSEIKSCFTFFHTLG